MKKIMTISLKTNLAYRIVFCIGLLFLAGCDHATEETSRNLSLKPPSPIVSSNSSSDINVVAIEAEKPTLVTSQNGMKINGANTYINFSDQTACQWTPSICSSSFVVWPGYIQNIGNGEFGYAWMSYGPKKSFISFDTGDHYHILGLFSPADEPNPAATAMFGTDWFAFYMQRSGTGRINFDLTQINVKGTVPITLWFKTATGTWKYWRSLTPGRWNLPGATNIQELHIRATSADANDKYSIDDILVKSI